MGFRRLTMDRDFVRALPVNHTMASTDLAGTPRFPSGSGSHGRSAQFRLGVSGKSGRWPRRDSHLEVGATGKWELRG